MQTFFKEFVILINIIYWLPMFICFAITLVVAWLLSSHFKIKKIYKIIISLIAACAVSLFWIIPAEKAEQQRVAKYDERKAKYEEAKAVFDEQCKKAGEKIYRTVDNGDGIILLKVWRENETGSYYALMNDQMWEYAGYRTAGGKYYIGSFLRKDKENFLGGDFFDGIGYQYVDIPNNGQFIHYAGMFNGENFVGDEEIISNSSARYAVTFETDVSPELRKYWVAGVTFKIIDLQNNEVLAEKTMFNFSQTLGKRMHGQSWTADNITCGTDGKLFRAFVFSVLKPKL